MVMLGPRTNFPTPESTNIVTTCHACGIPQVSRVECFSHPELKPDENREIFVKKNHDRMTECEYFRPPDTYDSGLKPEAVWTIPMMEKGPDALLDIDGLPFDASDRQRYFDYFVKKEGRDPTCVEIYDLANADSDHSRHHNFKSKVVIGGQEMPESE